MVRERNCALVRNLSYVLEVWYVTLLYLKKVIPLPTVPPSGTSRTRCYPMMSRILGFRRIVTSRFLTCWVSWRKVLLRFQTRVFSWCNWMPVSCVPHEWFYWDVEQKRRLIKFAQEVDVVQERSWNLCPQWPWHCFERPLNINFKKLVSFRSPVYQTNRAWWVEWDNITNGMSAFASGISSSLLNIATRKTSSLAPIPLRPSSWRKDFHS